MKENKIKKDILGEFQKVRTKAIGEMFDNPDEYGIYPTTKFFNVLDNFLSQKIDVAYQAGKEEARKEIDGEFRKAWKSLKDNQQIND